MFQTSCRANLNTHFVFSNFFFHENCAVYEVMWKNMVERGRSRHVRIACRIAKAHTQIMETYGFSIAIMVTRTRLEVTL